MTGEDEAAAGVEGVDHKVEALGRSAPGGEEGVVRGERANLQARVGETEGIGGVAAEGTEGAVERGGDAEGLPGEDKLRFAHRVGGAARGLRAREVDEGVRGHAVVGRRRGSGSGSGGGVEEVGVGVRRGPGTLDAASPDQAGLALEESSKLGRGDAAVEAAEADLGRHQVARRRRRDGRTVAQRSHGGASGGGG